MKENTLPQRGVDFDDYVGSMYFASDRFGLTNVQLKPVFCPANDNHDDDFVGIQYSGYRTEPFIDADGVSHKGDGLLIQGIAYPAKNFVDGDLDRLFDTTELQNGDVKHTAKSSISFDEFYVRACYPQEGSKRVERIKSEAKRVLSLGELDNLKWVAAMEGGEAIVLHGDVRKYNVKDAEE
jgi:hypothetical protein